MSEMDEPPPLADLQTAELDDATLDALFDDLQELAEIVRVQLKRAGDAYVDAAVVSLRDAQAALRERRCLGAQIHYRYGDELYVDTLLRGPLATRLTRMRLS